MGVRWPDGSFTGSAPAKVSASVGVPEPEETKEPEKDSDKKEAK